MFTCRRQNRSHMIVDKGQALLYSRQPTRAAWHHEVPNCLITSVFYICLCNSDSKFQATFACATAIQNFKRLIYLWIKIWSVSLSFLSKNKRNILVQTCFDFSEIFCFAFLASMFKQWEGGIRKTIWWWYVRKRIDHCCSVSTGKIGKPRFPLERRTLGLGFSCPQWTPMIDSICPLTVI